MENQPSGSDMSAYAVNRERQLSKKRKKKEQKKGTEEKEQNSQEDYNESKSKKQKVIKQKKSEDQQEQNKEKIKSTKGMDNRKMNKKLKGKNKKLKEKNKKLMKTQEKEEIKEYKNDYYVPKEFLKKYEEERKKEVEKEKVSMETLTMTSEMAKREALIKIGFNMETSPKQDARFLFEWMIYPVNLIGFFQDKWERNPMHVKRIKPKYYSQVVSSLMVDQLLRDHYIAFTKNLDITSYSDGVRETHNPVGRATPNIVWDYYRNKCSVRLLNPQTFLPTIHAINSILQEYFGCFVGANLYLTPPNSQGFAPHYDDVEAFILQAEGKKRWKVYKPLENKGLPRYSSRDFDESEIGEPMMDIILEAGDLLYLPRGTIHQAMTNDSHSLHVTISVNQRNSWCDFLEKMLPLTLKRATENEMRLRMGIPINYLSYVGTAYEDSDRRKMFKEHIIRHMHLLMKYIDIDETADLMAKKNIHDYLPPYISGHEQKYTVEHGGEKMENGVVKHIVEITIDTQIRLIRSHCIRLIKEDIYKLYYSTENSKEYHEYELQFLEVDDEYVPGIRQLIRTYPKFMPVKELNIEDHSKKIPLVNDLWDKNLIMTKKPLCTDED